MNRYTTILLLLLLLPPQLALATMGIADVAGEDPGLFMVMTIILLCFIGMVALVPVIFAVLAGIIALLAGLGITSVSVLVGWYHRSLRKGMSIFLQLSLITACTAAGVLLLFILAVFDVPWTRSALFCSGIVAASAAAGWVCSLIIKTIARLLLRRLTAGKYIT